MYKEKYLKYTNSEDLDIIDTYYSKYLKYKKKYLDLKQQQVGGSNNYEMTMGDVTNLLREKGFFSKQKNNYHEKNILDLLNFIVNTGKYNFSNDIYNIINDNYISAASCKIAKLFRDNILESDRTDKVNRIMKRILQDNYMKREQQQEQKQEQKQEQQIQYINISKEEKEKQLNDLDSIIINYNNSDFENYLNENWNNISNAGQQNCGIYLGKYNNNILKCISSNTYINKNRIIQVINNFSDFFPRIYNIHVDEENHYIEMEKFNSDVTDMIFKTYPELLINKIEQSNNIKNSIRLIYQINLTSFIYKYTSNYESVMEQLQNNEIIELNNIIEQLNVEDIQTIHNEYYNFINLFKSTIKELINNIIQQIFYIEYEIIKKGGYYTDMKFDNFAVKLEQNSREHFGCTFNNKIDDNLYYYIYIIDWDSGLQSIRDDEEYGYALDFFISEYFRNIKSLNIAMYNKNEIELGYRNKDILSILTDKLDRNLFNIINLIEINENEYFNQELYNIYYNDIDKIIMYLSLEEQKELAKKIIRNIKTNKMNNKEEKMTIPIGRLG